jgi:malate dehydrogenase (oxaloacetate-decarboxylating)(NADP+)
MKVAAVEAIAALARAETSDVVAAAYGGHAPGFGTEYIIPKPFDPRLILSIAPAVARAAMESGVARRPIEDFDAYENELEKFVYRSGQLMRPVFEVARQSPARRWSMPRPRKNACCARCRRWWTKVWPIPP